MILSLAPVFLLLLHLPVRAMSPRGIEPLSTRVEGAVIELVEEYRLVDDDEFREAPALERIAPATHARAASSFDIQVPKNDGWVTDLAHMLTPQQERELDALMESYKQGTTHEIALLTVDSLDGKPIEQFALEVGRAWGMGTKEKSNAALLVVSKKDREVRIEVARGLEGQLTDSISGRIIREVIVPQFKQGRFAEGLKAGVMAIHAAIGGKYAKVPKPARTVEVGLLGLLPLFFFGLVFLIVLIKISRWGGPGPWVRGPRGFGGIGGFPGGFGGGGLGGGGFGGGGGGHFGGFGGGGGFSGGGASGRW